MRWRLLAFLPVAGLMTLVVLASASCLVFALDATLATPPGRVTPIQPLASDCNALRYEIREISRRATGCDADLHCLGTPILCPITMDAGLESEYRALRRALSERCNADRDSFGPSEGGAVVASSDCRSAADDVVPSPRSSEPGRTTFVF